MRCYRGLTEGIQEPKLSSKKADIRSENADWKLERADLRLERADYGLKGQRTDLKPKSNKWRFRWLV